MAIHVDLSETDRPDKVGEFERVEPGPVHLLILEAKENGGKNNEHTVKFEVLMHPNKTQLGLTHTEFFPPDAKMAWKLLNFAYAAGIASREAMAAAKASGVQYPAMELQDAVGRQIFGTIKVTEKTDATGKVSKFHNLDSPLAINDPKAEHHPRNVGMLAQAMKSMPAAAVTTPATAAHSAPQHAPAADPFAAVT